MAVVCLALGSRGDVQPMAVLARAIRERGGEATIIGLDDNASVATELGGTFLPLGASLTSITHLVHGRLARRAAGTPTGQALLFRHWLGTLADQVARTVVATVRPGDALITGILTRDVALACTQAFGGPLATLTYTGMFPTAHRASHFGAAAFTGHPRRDRWISGIYWQVSARMSAASGAATRRLLGLPRQGGRSAVAAADAHPIILAASPWLVPYAPDWPTSVHQTGWLAPPDLPYEPSPDLADFLSAGEPPVYLGFGSMSSAGTSREADMLLRSAEASGLRTILPAVMGRSVGPLTDRIFAVPPLPHTWLFPRLAGVIHHGGAGTTHDALRAGVPTVAIPLGIDQPYHAWRLAQLGVGPSAPFRAARMHAPGLTALLRELVASPRTGAYARRAAEIGSAVRAEDGARATVDLLERLGFLG